MPTVPKISVITPSFNQVAFLEETIRSVIDQDYPNLEYIIIDGGSNDGSVDLIKGYEDNIHYWVSETDTGQSNAINKGFKMASGEIVGWLNSDDLYAPDVFRRVSQVFADNVVLVYGLTQAFGRGRKEEPLVGRVDSLPKLLGKMSFSQPSSFFKKEIIDKVGFLDENLHYGMDYDLVIRLLLQGESQFIPGLLAKYRFHQSSKSSGDLVPFAKDWAYSFSKLVRTFDAVNLINDLRNLGIYREGDDVYQFQKKVKKQAIEDALWYFLNEQTQAYYGDRKMDKAKELAYFIRKNNYQFFKACNLEAIYWRSRYIPKQLFHFLRR